MTRVRRAGLTLLLLLLLGCAQKPAETPTRSPELERLNQQKAQVQQQLRDLMLPSDITPAERQFLDNTSAQTRQLFIQSPAEARAACQRVAGLSPATVLPLLLPGLDLTGIRRELVTYLGQFVLDECSLL